MVNDITQRRQVETALRDSEHRFQMVVENLAEGILITDLKDIILYVNARMCAMTGYLPEELLGQTGYKILLSPQEWPEIRHRHAQRRQGLSERYELQVRCKDGTQLWTEVFGAPFHDLNGEIVGKLGTFTDIRTHKQTELALRDANHELKDAYTETIEGWSRALDLRDNETAGHSDRVTEMTLVLAEAMGVTEESLQPIRWGALLHDIGKMAIPDHILLKPGPLNEPEWEIMRRHPIYAYELLHPIAFLRHAIEIPWCHHEKWDGSGYPHGLSEEQIPLAARIFAVADVWDALCSDRPYRSSWPRDKVRQHIADLTESHFDPQVVEIFLQLQ